MAELYTDATRAGAREKLLNRAIEATTLGHLDEIKAVRAEVGAWLRAHGSDNDVAAVDAQLAKLEERITDHNPDGSINYYTNENQ